MESKAIVGIAMTLVLVATVQATSINVTTNHLLICKAMVPIMTNLTQYKNVIISSNELKKLNMSDLYAVFEMMRTCLVALSIDKNIEVTEHIRLMRVKVKNWHNLW